MSQMRKLAIILTIFICSACKHNNEPTFADKIKGHGDEMNSIATKWDKGNEMIIEGQELIKEGNKKIKKGESLVSDGKQKVSSGESKIKKGTKLKSEAEQKYKSYPLNTNKAEM